MTWWATTASCTWIAPFGVPVVPVVKCSSAMSSGAVGGDLEPGTAGGEQLVQVMAAGHVVPSGRSSRVAAEEQHVLELGQPVADGATFRRYSAGVVTSTRPSPRSRRCRIGSGPNAANNGQNTLPCFRVPSAATYSSRVRSASDEDAVAPFDRRARRGRRRTGR